MNRKYVHAFDGLQRMKFTHNTKINYWETNLELVGKSVALRLDTGHLETDRESVALSAAERITVQWKRLQKEIADSLHKKYNDVWSDPDDGLPRLTRKDFLDTLELRTVDVHDDNSLSLYFSDGGLFAGHTVNLFWTEDDAICKASLAG